MPEPPDVSVSSPDFDEAVCAAAAQFGVQREYWDIFGRSHPLNAPLAARILQTFGIDASSPATLAGSLDHHERQQWNQLSPPVAVVQDAIEIALRAEDTPALLSLTLECEDGSRHNWSVEWQELPTRARRGKRSERTLIVQPPPPLGYHKLQITLEAPGKPTIQSETRLIVCPPRAYFPPCLLEGSRRAGLAISLYGVHSQHTWGCGDFTALRSVIDWVARRSGGAYVALNPLHSIFNRQPYNTSPYLPATIFYRNFLYLDVEAVDDFIQSPAAVRLRNHPAIAARIARLNSSEFVEYEEVARLKRLFLLLAFRHFRRTHWQRNSPRAAEFARYLLNEGRRLDPYATFMSLDRWLHKRDPQIWIWPDWPAEYRNPESPAVRQFEVEHSRSILFEKYLQWQLDVQAEAAQRHARDQGLEIGLFHDLPLANDRCGADLWSSRDFFIDGCRVGSPPDDFAPEGQDWSFPPPNKFRHVEDGYRRFADSIAHSAKQGGALRIDHVMRLFRLYWIPEGVDATQGAYVRDNALDLLRVLALESVRHKIVIVGEDLGTVEPEMREMLQRFGILSYRLFYFERRPDGSLISPHEYPAEALVSSTTHDLPTIAGFWNGRDLESRRRVGLIADDPSLGRMRADRLRDKQHMLDSLHQLALVPPDFPRDAALLPELTGELHNAITGFLASTPSLLMTLNQEDLTKEPDQQNMPSTTHQYPNWRRKMRYSVEQLHSEPEALNFARMFRHWLERTGRL